MHSSTLAWRIPWTEDPGGLQSMGSQRVKHDLATKKQHITKGLLVCYLKVVAPIEYVYHFQDFISRLLILELGKIIV